MNEQDRAVMTKQVAERAAAQRVAAGLAPLGKASSLPDIPACDFCGKPYSANLSCSACQCVFYCTPTCQRAHWKQQKQNGNNSGGGNVSGGGRGGGHRSECKTMRETCEKMAKIAVQQMSSDNNNRDHSSGYTRIDNNMLSTLDGTGTYRAAVASGLNDAIRQLFIDDKAEVLKRYANPNLTGPRFCFTNSVVSTLFRGQRMEGQGMSNPNFGCIDGQRIKSYVKSHPDAFMHWWEASLEVYKMPLDNSVWELGTNLHSMAHMCARDLWFAWSLVFVDKRASRAILLPTSNNNTVSSSRDGNTATTTSATTSSADARAKYLATTLHKTLSRRWSVSDDRDDGCVLEGVLNRVTALIYLRLVEFKIIPLAAANNNFFDKLLKLKGSHKKMYQDLAVPAAKAMIAKGGSLTNDEYYNAVTHPPGHHH